MSIVNDNIKNASQCVIDWVLDKGYTDTSCATSIADNRIDSHPGVNCVGTLVASDIADKASCTDLQSLSNEVDDLKTAPGLYCTGTLVASDIASKASCADLIALNDKVDILENCASITGILTSDVFTLSGNTLVITM